MARKMNPQEAVVIINMHHVKEAGLDCDFSVSFKRFPQLTEIVEKDACCMISPVALNVHAEIVGEYVFIQGNVAITVKQVCSRCSEPFDRRYNKKIQLTYSKLDPDEIPWGDSIDFQMRANERGVYLFRGDMLDLNKGVEEHLIQTLSGRPLCSEACRGICSGCGENLNSSRCSCNMPSRDTAFEVLMDLRLRR